MMHYLTGELIHAGDLPLKHGDDVHVIPGVLIKIEREVIAAAPTLPMYQRVALVPASEIQKLDPLRQRAEKAEARVKELEAERDRYHAAALKILVQSKDEPADTAAIDAARKEAQP